MKGGPPDATETYGDPFGERPETGPPRAARARPGAPAADSPGYPYNEYDRAGTLYPTEEVVWHCRRCGLFAVGPAVLEHADWHLIWEEAGV